MISTKRPSKKCLHACVIILLRHQNSSHPEQHALYCTFVLFSIVNVTSQSLRNASFPWYFPLSNLLCRISVVLFHLIVYPYRKTAFWVIDRKSRFWRTLETNLDFKATHVVNLYFRVDMKSTLISKYSSDNFGDNLDLKGKSWIKPCNQGWFQNKTVFVHFESEVDFKRQLEYFRCE